MTKKPLEPGWLERGMENAKAEQKAIRESLVSVMNERNELRELIREIHDIVGRPGACGTDIRTMANCAISGIINIKQSVNEDHPLGVIDEILAEREHQSKKWGNAHDDIHHPNDWSSFIITYLGKAVSAFEESGTAESKLRMFRYNMIKIAAIAIAAVEAVDRKINRNV